MKFNFPNANGETLAGRLELPKTKPRAFALFAHCFTCSKNVRAAASISRKLTESNIAVLRFDFTGLGNSEGDFANTNFSSNVDDLVSACQHLSKEYETPTLLIGHSLGGAAVLEAAKKLPEVKAVVTLAAPSEAEHVSHLFDDQKVEILENGIAQVKLAGRDFTIKKQFLDDIESCNILDGVADMNKALLVMHSPTDNTVSVEHATKIFVKAKHPKSFVSLDNADHLITSVADAEYAADVIGAWTTRYLPAEDEKKLDLKQGEVLVKSRPGYKFTNDVYTKDHHYVADEPLSVKGNNLGMNPYDQLLGALGTCTSMTMRMYADRKGFELEDVTVRLSHKKIHANDCEDCETLDGMVDHIYKTIEITGNLTEEEKTKILELAERCPVNRTLQSEVKVVSDHV